jgi:ArsR family transcriptional regulator, arsenate/arsenite/antimonite-responsive transcriptional repressor / arsenate reductase (thioredoxin)
MVSAGLLSPPSQPGVVHFFKALADETRLQIVRMLLPTDLRAGEIRERIGLPANAVSYHLKHLRAAGLLRDHRSSLDARDIYYSVDLEQLYALYDQAGDALRPEDKPDGAPEGGGMYLDRPLRVIFLCTHNSARSQLAEGILRQMGGDLVEVFSAGSSPREVHPETIELLREWNINTREHSAKQLSHFIGQDFDYIITVCDRVREECPTFPGDPVQMHWSLPDPLAVDDAAERDKVFRAVGHELRTRIQYLLLVPDPVSKRRLRWRGGV